MSYCPVIPSLIWAELNWKLILSQISPPGSPSLCLQAGQPAGKWFLEAGELPTPGTVYSVLSGRRDRAGGDARYSFTTPTQNPVWMGSCYIICWQILPTSLQRKPWRLWSWLCLSPHCGVRAAFLHFEALKELHEVEETRKEAVTPDTLVVLFWAVHPVPRNSCILNR